MSDTQPACEEPKVSKARRFALYVLLSIVLGTIGSGCWETIARPILFAIGRALLWVSTLGVATLRDEIYSSIAQGHHNTEALTTLMLGFGVIIGVLSTLLIRKMELRQSLKARLSENVARPDPPTEDSEVGKTPRQEAMLRYQTELEEQIRRIRRRQPSRTVVAAIICVMLLYTGARTTYVNNAITYFEQCMTICRPHMNDSQERKLRAQFAGIENREDYVAVTTQLKVIADRNNAKLPEFIVW